MAANRRDGHTLYSADDRRFGMLMEEGRQLVAKP